MARTFYIFACRISFANKRETFQGKHSCVRKADPPGAYPSTFRFLGGMQIPYSIANSGPTEVNRLI
jgi:hypothetical protein